MFSVPENVRPGDPVRAAHQNMVYDALRRLSGIKSTKGGAFQRSRVAGEPHPFSVSASIDAGKLKITVQSGMWFGDGKTNFAQTNAAGGDGEIDAWVLYDKSAEDTEQWRPPLKLEISAAESVWVMLRARIENGVIFDKENFPPECVAEARAYYTTGNATGYVYVPVAKIECKKTGEAWEIQKTKQYLKGDFFYGGGIGERSHPFKITYDASENVARIEGGLWIGDGVSARGADIGTEYSALGDIRGQDTFTVDPTEVSLSVFNLSSEAVYFAVCANTKYGRICPTSLLGESETHQHRLGIETLGTATDKERIENLIFGMTPEVRFLGKISEGEVVQIVRDNIHYSPSVPAGMPLHFYPRDEAPNTFECIGGLLMCNIPRTLNRDRMISAPEKVDTEELASQSVGGFRPAADPFGSAAEPIKTFTLQRRLVPIPRYAAILDGESGTEADASRTNGYLVALRVRMRYDLAADHDFYNGDNSPAFPRPEITWELIQVPKSNSTPQNMWEFGTELIPAGTEGSASCPSTFLGEMPGAPVELGIQGFGPVSEVDGWEYMQALALLHLVPAEEYESLIPIGMFYKPVRQDISATPSEDVSERRGRWLYMPLKRGIVEWTPPIDFKPWSQTVIE